MNISSITDSIASLTNKEISPLNKTDINTNEKTFDAMLKDAISEVNESQKESYKAMEGIATGNVKNLQEAVQKIEEGELSLKLALEVKNKAVNAYKEVMQMQV